MNSLDQAEYKKKLEQQQAELLKRATALKFMTKEARERINRIKLVKPGIAEQVETALVHAVQSGQIKDRITESQVVMILDEISNRKKFRILKK